MDVELQSELSCKFIPLNKTHDFGKKNEYVFYRVLSMTASFYLS